MTGFGLAVFEQPLFFPFPVPILVACPLVMEFFTLCDADLQFRHAFLPIQGCRHQGIALALDQADQFIQLAAMQQQFAGADGVRVDMGGGSAEGHDMGAEQERLAILDGDVTLFDLNPPLTQALHFPALQGDAGFVAFFDEIVVPRLFIERDGGAPLGFFLCFACHRPILMPEKATHQ